MSDKSEFLVQAVEVLMGGRSTPLVPTQPILSSRGVGWEEIALEAHSTPPCDHPYHEHPTHFLQLQLTGPARFEWTVGGRTRSAVANRGTIFIIPRGTYDRVQWTSPTDRIALALHPHLVTHALEETDHLQDIDLKHHFELTDPHIESLILALRADLQDGSPAGRLYGESLATALAVYLQKRYAAVTTPKSSQWRGGMPGIRLNRVLEYIRANTREDVKLSALAEIANMSPHYFCELFKQSTGLSPHRYVLRAKIECAKEYLSDLRVNVFEVSVLTGFADQSYFTKVFRRVVGVTPTEFRARLASSKQPSRATVTGTRGLWIETGLLHRADNKETKPDIRVDERLVREDAFDGVIGPKVGEVVESVIAERESDDRRSLMMDGISGLLESGNWKDASRLILHNAVEPTRSEYGFVGVILDSKILRLLAHEGFKSHETINRQFFEEKLRGYDREGFLDFEESDNLVAAVVHQKQAVLSNSPSTDPRSGGLPAGHPQLRCFLGVPALKEQEVVGMIGVANRPRGYTENEVEILQSCISSVAALYDCYCRMQVDGRPKKLKASAP
jgi:AraC family transcriptional regulator